MCLPEPVDHVRHTPRAERPSEPALTLEVIAANQSSPEGFLARQLIELRKRVEDLERYAGNGLP